jgi:hypothetical protein
MTHEDGCYAYLLFGATWMLNDVPPQCTDPVPHPSEQYSINYSCFTLFTYHFCFRTGHKWYCFQNETRLSTKQKIGKQNIVNRKISTIHCRQTTYTDMYWMQYVVNVLKIYSIAAQVSGSDSPRLLASTDVEDRVDGARAAEEQPERRCHRKTLRFHGNRTTNFDYIRISATFSRKSHD